MVWIDLVPEDEWTGPLAELEDGPLLAAVEADWRSAPLSDRRLAVLEFAVTAYYAYANRTADGLGVDIESWIPDDDPLEIGDHQDG